MYFLGAAVLVVIATVIYWGVMSAPKIEAPMAEKLDGTEEFGIVYYFGRECPHCVNVQKFLDENKVAEKVMFTKKEVWHNVENAKELDVKAEECGLEKENVGVPFLYANGKCFIGEIEVKNFFQKEAGIK